MSEEVVLMAKKREIKTKGTLKDYRKEGLIPAILYGGKKEPSNIIIDKKEFLAILNSDKGEHAIISLSIDGSKKSDNVIIRDMQVDPISREIQHVDLQRISMTEKIEVHIPFELKGALECVGVKKGGIVELVMHSVTVRCLPSEMMKSIVVDVANLDIGQTITLLDLGISPSIEVIGDKHNIVANIVMPRAEEEVKAETAPTATEPELISKGKPEEEEENKEEKAGK